MHVRASSQGGTHAIIRQIMTLLTFERYESGSGGSMKTDEERLMQSCTLKVSAPERWIICGTQAPCRTSACDLLPYICRRIRRQVTSAPL